MKSSKLVLISLLAAALVPFGTVRLAVAEEKNSYVFCWADDTPYGNGQRTIYFSEVFPDSLDQDRYKLLDRKLRYESGFSNYLNAHFHKSLSSTCLFKEDRGAARSEADYRRSGYASGVKIVDTDWSY